jgi:putative peptide zinc metalloprotease protein
MNLSEALDVALPEMPQARLAHGRPPCVDPDLLVREEMLDGEPVIGVLQRDTIHYFRFSRTQWDLAQLFDGSRTYEEIAELFTAQTGMLAAADEVRAFAEGMEQSDFWYKTPQEKNVALGQKLTNQRGRRSNSKGSLAHIGFSAWDPDRYMAWLDRRVGRFIYSKWSVLFALLLFTFEAAVFINKWNVLIPDTRLYFSFADKSWMDLLQFWVLLFVVGFIHETAHGLTCRHYGGQVHSMGLMFLYLLPCFFCDVTEIWISASKIQRVYAILAGIWIESTICGLAMIVWTNTSTGGWLHDFMYQIILFTGIAIVVINLNPLIKLDGYYLLTEIIEIPDLKERSTAFLSAWVQSKILRLQVEIPIVPRRRVAAFMIYAFFSGAYSYVLLFVVIRFAYNIAYRGMGEFAVVPAGALAFFMFRSRLSSLRRVIVQWWSQKMEAGLHWGPMHWVAAILAALVLFTPLWRDREDGYYVIEPSHTRVLHAPAAGRIEAILVRGGEKVRTGEPLLRMSSMSTASMRSAADARTGSSRFEAYNAELRGQSIGTAAADQSAASQLTNLAGEAQSKLSVTAPADGIVVTETPSMLLDRDVASGQDLIEVADDGPRVVRIYIPSSALSRIPRAAEVALVLPGEFSIRRLALASPNGDAVPLPPGIIAAQAYKGIQLATYYCSRMELPAAKGNTMFGVSGDVKIFGNRRSLAGRALLEMSDLLKAHVW